MGIDLHSFVMADPQKCIGCRVCEVACAVAHNARTVKTVGDLNALIMPRLYLVQTPEITMPVQCHHCEDAPCAKSCPVAAIGEQHGQIMINEKICIGCKSCMMACPFGAIELIGSFGVEDGNRAFEPSEVIASKCDLCGGSGAKAACVAACPQDALQLIDMKKIRKQRRLEAASKMGIPSTGYSVRAGL